MSSTVLTVSWGGEYAGTFSQKKILWENFLESKSNEIEMFIDGARGPIQLSYSSLCRAIAMSKEAETEKTKLRDADGNVICCLYNRAINESGISVTNADQDSLMASGFKKIVSGFMKMNGSEIHFSEIQSPELIDQDTSIEDEEWIALKCEIDDKMIRVTIQSSLCEGEKDEDIDEDEDED